MANETRKELLMGLIALQKDTKNRSAVVQVFHTSQEDYHIGMDVKDILVAEKKLFTIDNAFWNKTEVNLTDVSELINIFSKYETDFITK